jgi:hypothetical protein
MKIDMSAKAVSHRLRRVSELVRVCRALAGPRRKSARPAGMQDRERGAKPSSGSFVSR